MDLWQNNPAISVVVLSTAFFYALATVIVPKICKNVIPRRYTTLSDNERISMNINVAKGINGMLVFSSALWILLHQDFSGDYLGTDSIQLRFLISVEAGYLISDLILLFHGAGISTQRVFLFHHIVCLIVYFIVLDRHFCLFHVALRIMNEMSTSFYSARSILSTLKLKDSRIYVINGFLFMLTFFLSRVLLIPVHYYTWGMIPPKYFLKYNRFLPHLFYASSMSIDVLNVYWFALMFRGFLRYSFKLRVTHKEQKKD